MKTYLSFLEKRNLVKSIVSYSLVEDENGILTRDRFLQELVTVLFCEVLINEKEIEGLFDEDGSLNIEVAIAEYDKLRQSDDFDGWSHTDGEVRNLINQEINDRLEANNSIPSLFNKALLKLIEKIPDETKITDLLKSLPELMKGLNPSTLGLIGNVLGGELSGKKSKGKKQG
jgi:hypothetical protein